MPAENEKTVNMPTTTTVEEKPVEQPNIAERIGNAFVHAKDVMAEKMGLSHKETHKDETQPKA
ncbi:hypothetical protein CAOG_08886 [Capsaspora owczarzaki ATCC 30864]|uniref:Uncharacterized protein n=1 Tax=Capsaspora owczarzaki (strain ATCC 30864) TaxID=595528 RepID=A0A0D2VU03_CAPO3|nr:hypothetical protein CAOG_08886 [Capsaspora owczarzaki ATCC 30864]KJE94837.1 hypothetical protein CAOG_008886 [Capsaspora owczarzaki ATCC 30864]|eukprot:XP_011270548.1 hypothetical protein CAOG_08886 [Capsaspora owczarzaki ATCC 30864]